MLTAVRGERVDEDEFRAFYGIPREHAHDRVVVKLTWGDGADVRVYRGRRIVWRRPAKPSEEPPKRKLPGTTLEASPRPDGNGLRQTDRR